MPVELHKRSAGNNYYRWTRDRLEQLRLMLQFGHKPSAIALAMHCHDTQCVEYGKRKLGWTKKQRRAA